MKHTEGNWFIKRENGIIDVYSDSKRHKTIARVNYPIGNIPVMGQEDEMDANAKIIAAAPDLLEALKKVMTWVHTHPKKATIVQSVIDEADNAIKKATSSKITVEL